MAEWRLDPRGVLRGGCTLCPCACYDNGGAVSMKCGCGHPPGKHRRNKSPASLSPPGVRRAGCSEAVGSMLIEDICDDALEDVSGTEVYDGALERRKRDDSRNSPAQLSVQHQSIMAAWTCTGLNEDALLPAEQRCKYGDCKKRRCKEGEKEHEFCCRRHAKLYSNEQPALDSGQLCKTPGCKKTKYKRDDGKLGYYDYCSRYCRDNQGRDMVVPTSVEECALPGCHDNRYYDPSNKRIHDFCCRSHAAQASTSDGIAITTPSHQEVVIVTKKFKETWSHRKGQCPTITSIFTISNTKLKDRWNEYQETVSHFVTEKYFHGTKLMCDITTTKALCSDTECGVCGIANIGFDRRCIRKNINFQRFGHGFYLAPNSSKCHDYTQGWSGYRAMLLFDVCPGNKYQLQTDDEKLKAPPEGYNSVHGKHGISLNYDELVLYNPDAALPKYIVVYQKDGDNKIAT